MRDLILTMSISIDGCVAGPNGELEWMFGPDQVARAWKLHCISDASLHIMGSKTFCDMADYWPTATDAFAQPMNEIPKAVFSKQGAAFFKPALASMETEIQLSSKSWAEAYVASGDLATEIAKLKAQDGKPIRAHGGAEFARSIIAENLVDQYALLVHPVILGTGLTIFSHVNPLRRLTLISSTAFPGGSVAQIYKPANTGITLTTNDTDASHAGGVRAFPN